MRVTGVVLRRVVGVATSSSRFEIFTAGRALAGSPAQRSPRRFAVWRETRTGARALPLIRTDSCWENYEQCATLGPQPVAFI